MTPEDYAKERNRFAAQIAEGASSLIGRKGGTNEERATEYARAYKLASSVFDDQTNRSKRARKKR